MHSSSAVGASIWSRRGYLGQTDDKANKRVYQLARNDAMNGKGRQHKQSTVRCSSSDRDYRLFGHAPDHRSEALRYGRPMIGIIGLTYCELL